MRFSRIENIKEFCVANKKLFVAVLISACSLLVLQGYIGGARTECLGVADSKETTIAFETPVAVKRLFVLPGQRVRKGQPLIEVEHATVNLKLLEVQTALEALRSEQNVRNSLLSSFGKMGSAVGDPLAMEISGLQAQANELKRQQAYSVRYAEEDGVVGSVSYREGEQVQPFLPIITLTSNAPNLVYGFIHESRFSEFRVGDRVTIDPVSGGGRSVVGKVVSVGSRITAFHERLQTGTQARPMVFGREVMVTLPRENAILIGEKVSIRATKGSFKSEFGFQAFADSQGNEPLNSVTLGENLPFEAGGALLLNERNSLLIASDETGPNGSPFWMMNLADPTQYVNLTISGIRELDDVESITSSAGHMYAMSSLSLSKKGKNKPERNKVIRFTIENNEVKVNREFEIRELMLAALSVQPLLQPVVGSLETLEVEAFTMDQSDAYFALKNPRFSDGTSVILRIRGLGNQIESGQIAALNLDIYAMVRLASIQCDDPGRVTDLAKLPTGLLILSNCSKSESAGQLWWASDSLPQQPSLIASLRNGHAEGMAVATDQKSAFVASDSGQNIGSTLIRVDSLAIP